ncbi:hypothetical protein HDV63DRAFT_195834 [Trichoderma sp. SZMC 28014]
MRGKASAACRLGAGREYFCLLLTFCEAGNTTIGGKPHLGRPANCVIGKSRAPRATGQVERLGTPYLTVLCALQRVNRARHGFCKHSMPWNYAATMCDSNQLVIATSVTVLCFLNHVKFM